MAIETIKKTGKEIPSYSSKEQTVWLTNPHGTKVALPKSLAAWRLSNFPGYAECEPEFVPEEKEYPDDPELTEKGDKRRKTIREKKAKRSVGRPKGPEEAPKTDEAVKAELDAKAEAGENLTKEEYRLVSWQVLRKYGRSHGLDVANLRREQILEQLDKSSL